MLKTCCYSLLTGLCLLLASPAAQAQRSVTTQALPPGGGGPVEYVAPEETPWSHLVDSQIPTHISSSLTALAQ